MINLFNNLLNSILVFLFIVVWLAGIVLAKGAIMTILTICFPPFGWYLIVEKLIISNNLI